ncbi:MAG: carboxymuconolactone decarboxylase family protein [Rhodospirillales bacterium]|nr:carboxymuconolactone decarboxylase family protein [Rhodospirillales bacterium]
MSRLPIPTLESMTAEQRQVYDDIRTGPRGAVGGPFPVLLISPKCADPLQKLGAYLRYETPLSARVRELATIIAARQWTCQIEWQSHEPLAIKAGVPAPLVAAIKSRAMPTFEDATDKAVYDVSTELLNKGTVSEATHKAAVKALGAQSVVELVVLVGYYTTLAMTINAHGIPPKGGVPPLAP